MLQMLPSAVQQETSLEQMWQYTSQKKIKRESSYPHLLWEYQSRSELVHFAINYLMILEFNIRVSEMFSAKIMGVIYAVSFCIRSVTFWWRFGTSVTVAYIPHHIHRHELQTYLQLVDRDSFVYSWCASIHIIFTVSQDQVCYSYLYF